MISKQFVITVAAGKRLIGKAVVNLPEVKEALKSGTIVVIAGTTNGYVAEELLQTAGINKAFVRDNFYRGLTMPPLKPVTEKGRVFDESGFPGDVVLVGGRWKEGLSIFDVIDDLKEGDIILKGANTLDIDRRKAGILIGDPKAGTIGVSLQAVAGRRVRLIIPVGLEKRIAGRLDDLSLKLNMPGAGGPRLLPVPGRVVTEIDAISMMTGTTAEFVAAGGVCGAEGSVRLAVSGERDQVEAAGEIIKAVQDEPPFGQ